MAEQPEKKGLSAEWAVAEVDHLFTTLGRYTRFVVLSKWFLLVLALGLMTTLIALPLISKDRSGLRVSFVDGAETTKRDAAKPVMSNPEYRGTNEKGEQYKLNGLRAVQTTPTLVTIDAVEGQLLGENGSWRSISSNRGEYNQESKVMELLGNVTLVDDQGYTFITEQATIDTHTTKVTGNQRITGTGPMGNLLASGFEIRDNGAHIIFMGGTERVQLHIDRKKKN